VQIYCSAEVQRHRDETQARNLVEVFECSWHWQIERRQLTNCRFGLLI
jgi:hypothetical protein